MAMTPVSIRKAEACIAFLDLVHEFDDLRHILNIVKYPRPAELAKALSISQTSAGVMISKMVTRRYFRRAGHYHPAEITPTGETRVDQCVREIRKACKDFVAWRDNPDAQAKAEKAEEPTKIRGWITLVLRDQGIDAHDATRLEDLGYARRLPGRKIEVTSAGLVFFRGVRRGPLPGHGNRATMVRPPRSV